MSLNSQVISLASKIQLEKAEDWELYTSNLLDAVDLLGWGNSLLVPTKATEDNGGDLKLASFEELPIIVGARNRNEAVVGVALPDEVLKLDDGVWTKYYSKLSPDEKDNRRKLFAFVGMTLGQSYIDLKTGRRDSGLLLAKVRKRVEGPRLVQLLKLKKQLDGAHVDNHGGDISKFAAHIQKVAGQLVALGKRIDDDDKVLAFIQGLPEDRFSEIVTFIVNQPTWDFSDVVVRVGTHAARKENAEEKQDQLNALGKYNDRSDRKGRGRGRGRSRGRGSRRTDFGRGRANRNSGFLRGIKCHHCGIEGHFMKECRKLKREQRQRRDANTSGMMRTDAEDLADLWSTGDGRYPKNCLIFDSGCTRSVTNKKELLTDLSPDGNRGMRLADGQTRYRSSGTGTLRVKTPNGRILEIKDVAFIPFHSTTLCYQAPRTSEDRRWKTVRHEILSEEQEKHGGLAQIFMPHF
mmetsp:Transcript_13729/g.19052  ORF Transcript_13729/g.19052 Transcript_13729/m.19052 type:complete len:464 (+) Transcript_13729:181-1572(+)